jgi:hypothetical protein
MFLPLLADVHNEGMLEDVFFCTCFTVITGYRAAAVTW